MMCGFLNGMNYFVMAIIYRVGLDLCLWTVHSVVIKGVICFGSEGEGLMIPPNCARK